MLFDDQNVKLVQKNKKNAFKHADIQPHDLFSNCFVIIYRSCISGLFQTLHMQKTLQSDQQKLYYSIIM